MTIELIPLEGLPEVEPGDDLASLLEPSLRRHGASDGDVLAITQKVVSKAEGRIVPGDDRASWVDRESVAVVARRGDLLITRTKHGLVCANAGVDASNVAPGFLTLLPEDPDASAERLQKELVARLGLARLAVVVTDTFGRPWREGVVDVAIGCAGIPAVLDLRGTVDDHGTVLETTVVALADAVAAASGLVMTKTARVPAALVRGLDRAIGGCAAGSRARPRPRTRRRPVPRIRRGGPRLRPSERRVRLRRRAVGAVLEDAMATASPPLGAAVCSFVAVDSTAGRRRLLAVVEDPDDALRSAPVLVVPCVGAALGTSEPATLLTAGAAIRSLLVALHAQDLAWSWDPGRVLDPDRVRAALTLDPERRPIGVVAVGPMPEGGA